MDKTIILLIVILIALMAGAAWYAGVEQTRIASAQAQVESQLARAPEGAQVAAHAAEGLLVKALTGAVVSLALAAGVMLYQAARIAELRGQGWGRFWERRRVREPKRPRQPSLQELLTAALMRDLTRDDGGR